MIKCEKCTYFEAQPNDENDEQGRCHRYPPVYDSAYGRLVEDSSTESSCAWVWTLVDFNDWCGEFAKSRWVR